MDKKGIEQFLQEAIDNKKRIIVISPHADDAMLSLGGLLSYASTKTAVEIVTLFNQSSSHISLSARRFVKQCGFTRAQDLYEERKKEDKQACQSIGVQLTDLNFTEALFRTKRKQNTIQKILGHVIPETSLLYPTYIFHIAKGKIHTEDKQLVDEIAQKLQKIIPNTKDVIILAPLAIGGHVDHKIAKLATKKVFNPVFYFDQPYYNRSQNSELIGYPFSWQNEKNLDKKSSLISYYKTQVKPLFGSTQIPYLPEKFAMTDILAHSFPLSIGKYVFLQELVKSDSNKAYRYGLYKSQNGKVAFAKHWQGDFKGRYFYFLKNEISASALLSQLDSSITGSRQGVTFPKLLASKQTKNSLTMLTTFEKGTNLIKLSSDKKVEIIKKALDYFDHLNASNNRVPTNKILDRRFPYFFSMLPYVFITNMLRQPKSVKILVKSLLYIGRNFSLLMQDKTYGFVHRDIGEKNILVFGRKILIHDMQLSCIASPIVDYATVYLKANLTSGLKEKILQKIILKKYQGSKLPMFFSYVLYLALYELSMLSKKDYHITRKFIDEVFKEIGQLEKKQIKQQPKDKKTASAKSKYTSLLTLAVSQICMHCNSVIRTVKNGVFRKLTLLVTNNKLVKIIVGILIALSFLAILTSYIKGTPKPGGLYYQKELDTRVGGPYEASSSTSRYALVIAMVKNHSFVFDKNLGSFAAPDVTYYKGNFFTLFTPGVSFLGVPFYIVGSIFGSPQIGTYLLVLFTAVGNCLLIAIITKKLTGSAIGGIISGLIFLFATDGLSYALTFTQHHLSVCIMLLLLLNSLAKRSLRNNVIFGLLYATGLLMDIPNGVIFLPVLLYVLSRHVNFSDDTQKINISLRLNFVGIIIGLIPILLLFGYYNFKTTGSFTKIAQFIGGTAHFNSILQNTPLIQPVIKTPSSTLAPIGNPSFVFKTRIQLDGIYTLLISKERAWWYYSPIVLLGTLGLYILFKRRQTRFISLLLIAMLCMDVVLYSMFGDPWGGWAFGPRYLIPGAAILAIGVGIVLAKYKQNIIFCLLFFVLLGYSLWVNSLGALTTAAIPPQQAAQGLPYPITYTYAYNAQLVSKNITSSLLYNALFFRMFTVHIFLILLVGYTIFLFIVLYIFLQKEKEESL